MAISDIPMSWFLLEKWNLVWTLSLGKQMILQVL